MTAAFSITPAASDEFNVFLAGQDVAMPLRLDPENIGVILDADGRDFVTVDVNGERSDAEADRIAQLIMVTMNRFGGFAVKSWVAG